MSKVEVLCPSGHRINVKITPNTKILQILEEVCNKKKFLPPEDYQLKHGRNFLDLTLTVRYAGLPNLAKLELVKSSSTRTESNVMTALQLEDGQRLQTEFPPSTSLWDILLHWENQPNSIHKDKLTKSEQSGHSPVCIYMREEMIGELSLKETTLRKLGLTSGRTLIRLVHRAVDESTLQQIQNAIEKEKDRQKKISSKAAEIETTRNSQSEPVQETSKRPHCSMSMETEEPTSKVSLDESGSAVSMETNSSVETERNVSSTVSEPMEVDICETHFTKVEQQKQGKGDKKKSTPDLTVPREGRSQKETEPKPGTSKSAEEGQGARPKTRGRGSTPEEALRNIPGVEVYRPGTIDLTPEQEQVARSLAQTLMPGIILDRNRPAAQTSHTLRQEPQPRSSYAEFKFPEESRGKNLYQNELSEVNRREYKPCDREIVLYSLDRTRRAINVADEDLPDDFFEVTESDVKRMYSDLQKALRESSDQMLMTQSMKKAQFEDRFAKYDRVAIRFHFPDRMILQAIFRPRETVFALQTFIKKYLEDKTMPFYLYTTPPKAVLKDKSDTLIEANLVPMSVVYFGSDVRREHYLSEEVLDTISTQEAAEAVVSRCMHVQSDVPQQNREEIVRETRRANNPGGQGHSAPAEKVPKWFKTGKK